MASFSSTHFLTSLLALMSIFHVSFACRTLSELVQDPTNLLKYHNGSALSCKISGNVIWYGKFNPSQIVTSLSSSQPINLGSLLAGTATNPFGDGFYPGKASASLEAASTCTGAYAKGAYPGYAGDLLLDPTSGASFLYDCCNLWLIVGTNCIQLQLHSRFLLVILGLVPDSQFKTAFAFLHFSVSCASNPQHILAEGVVLKSLNRC